MRKIIILLAILLFVASTGFAATGDILYQNCTPSGSCNPGNTEGINQNPPAWHRTVETSGCYSGSCLKLIGEPNSNTVDGYGAGDTGINVTAVNGKNEITISYLVKFDEDSHNISSGNIKHYIPYMKGGARFGTVINKWPNRDWYMSHVVGTFRPASWLWVLTNDINSAYAVPNGDGTYFTGNSGYTAVDFVNIERPGITWKKFTTYIRMPSTPTASDGVVKIWYGDELMLDYWDVKSQYVPTEAALYFLTFYSSSEAKEPFEHWMDDMVIYEGYVPPVPDTTFYVQSTSPTNGSTGIVKNDPVGTGIIANKNFDCSTVSNITISPGSRTVSCSGTSVTLTTSGQIDNTLYTVTVPATVKSSDGLSMTPYSFSYTTATDPVSCATNPDLCYTSDECTTAYPTYNFCPDELSPCTPNACVNSCDVVNWQLCDTELECEDPAVGKYWWEGACRDVAESTLVTGANLLTNPNLTDWQVSKPNLPVGYISYNEASVARNAMGIRMFNGGGIAQKSVIQPNTQYYYAYNYIRGIGNVELWHYNESHFAGTVGTQTGTFTTPATISDDGLYIKGLSDAYVNHLVLKTVSSDGCATNPDLCATPDTCEAAEWYFYDSYCHENAPSMFIDNFSDGDATGWTTVNNSTVTPAWSVVDQVYKQTANTASANWSYYEGAYSYYGAGSAWTDYKVWSKITTLSVGGLMFRYVDNNNYYRLSFSKLQGFYRLEKKYNGVFSTMKVSGAGPVGEQNILAEVNGSLINITVNGEKIFSATDEDLTTGTIALYSLGQTQFDNIAVEVVDSDPSISITSHTDLKVYPSNSVEATAIVKNLPTDGYVRFFADSTGSDVITAPPFTATFNDLETGNRTITAILYNVDDDTIAYDSVNIGVGGVSMVAIGDSITRGSHDTISTDNTSTNGRNISQGFTPILTGWLETNINKPVMVYNEGISGAKSSNGVAVIDSLLERHPDSDYYLIMYGTNDSSVPVSSGKTCTEADFVAAEPACEGTYKNMVRDVILTVKAAGKHPLLALVPYTTNSSFNNTYIQDYNIVAAQLINEHNLATDAPDFYTYFQTNPTQLDDGVHPNGTGYQAMANLWYQELTNYFSGIFEPSRASVIHATIH
jgi:lysophospholipase L1-like esterase